MSTQAAQVALSLPLATLTGLQWVTWLAIANNVVLAVWPQSPALPWLVHRQLVVDPGGLRRVHHAAGPDGYRGARRADVVVRLKPGTYRRGGGEHLRVWLAERLADASGAENLAGAPWLVYYARALGNDVGKGVDLHSAPPVTGMLTLGHRSSVEPEVDLSGHWIDGDLFHVGTDNDRRRRDRRGAHHAAAGRGGRQERRCRAWFRRRRQGQERAVLEGLTGGEVR